MFRLFHAKATRLVPVAAMSMAIAGVTLVSGAVARAGSLVSTDLVAAAGSQGQASNVDVKLNIYDRGDSFDFNFVNRSKKKSAVTRVWFEQGLFDSLGLVASSRKTAQTTGTVLLNDASNRVKRAPGLLKGEDWDDTDIAYLANHRNAQAGINQGGKDRFRVSLKKGNSALQLSDVLQALITNGSRIGVRVDGLQDKTKLALITAPDFINVDPSKFSQFDTPRIRLAPTPSAMGAGLVLLTGLCFRRRRRGEIAAT